jgi:uncharacterized protein YhaN
MKILKLDLRAFGPFSDVSLDLSAGSHGFHLVYGPNEAGKSSALRALRNLLYGIPANTSDDFIHSMPSLRIGAVLARRDGQRLEIVRRKGNKGTLLPVDGKEPLEDSVLHGFLGGCDQAQFETMFGIDHAGLIRGGQEIIRGQGDIGHVLFAAGAGISDLRTIRGNLEKEANELFQPRALKPAVNQALGELNKAKKLIRETQLPSGEWQRHKSALEETVTELAAVEERLGELSRRKTKLERLAQALPTIARLREREEQLSRLGDVPTLPADFAENRRDTISRLDAARRSEEEAVAEVARLDGLLAESTVPEGLLWHGPEIEDAYKELGVYRKAQNDLPSLVAKREQREKEAALLLKELRPDLTLADTEPLKLASRQRVEIQELANRKEALENHLLQAQQETAESREQLAEASDRLAGLPPTSDPTLLAEAVRQARSQGNPVQQASAWRAEIAALTEQAAIDLHKLGQWNGPLDALETLALPEMETIARFDRSFSEAQDKLAQVQSSLEKARGESAGIEHELDRLRREGEAPSEADLADARRIRDSGWQLVLQTWRNETIEQAAVDAFLAAASDSRDLVTAYEQAVRRADDLSDRLRREANRVANRAGLQARQLSLHQQIVEMDRQLASTVERLRQIEREWSQSWQPAGICPLPPREMQAWTQRQQYLVQQAQTIRLRKTSLTRLEDEIALHCERLQACLDDMVRMADSAGMVIRSDSSKTPTGLDALLARGDSILEKIRETADSRRQLETERNRLSKQAAQAEIKTGKAEADLARWRSQWVAAIQPLRLPENTSPMAVHEVLAQTSELIKLLDDAAGYAERIEGIERDARRFRENVERLLATIDPGQPPPGDRFAEALEAIVARLRQAMSDHKKRDVLEAQRKQQEDTRRQAHTAFETLRATLSLLCQEARCQTPEELPAAETASAELLRLRRERETCLEQLLQLGAGATIDVLMTEAAAVSADSVPGELQNIDGENSELDRKRGELRERIGGEKRALDGMDTSAAAAVAAEDAQEILARLEPDVQQYLRLRLASAVLREGIERYRKKNEGPVLNRASELFRRLTLGSFNALRIDFGEHGEQLLAGVRPDGKTVPPTAMSEGTCDQLYLALRLASLETWLTRNEPMPFIVDDILVSFDNRRALATLEVLAELSARTQVIFFAHHEHLVELATTCMSSEVLFVHRL